MKYMGSKRLISKYILPIMLQYRSSKFQTWVEPFVGGANLIDKVIGDRIGGDYNKFTIDGLLSIRDRLNTLPKNKLEFYEKDYKVAKQDITYPNRGYIGYALSYGGKWFGGWCRDKLGKRDYVAESYRNAVKQSKLLQGVNLYNTTYKELVFPENSIIYCDPPYKNTTKYTGNNSSFNYNDFYKWCILMKYLGHTVFISEYDMPDMFECIWSKEVNSSLTKNTGSKKNIEKLFKVR